MTVRSQVKPLVSTSVSELLEDEVAADPLEQFRRWFAEAQDDNRMALASCDVLQKQEYGSNRNRQKIKNGLPKDQRSDASIVSKLKSLDLPARSDHPG